VRRVALVNPQGRGPQVSQPEDNSNAENCNQQRNMAAVSTLA
jgi:hypothetical protein